ncbi:MAG: hypothetical protein BEN19_02240 [Epulopiscium sp. Nuni2H_MBin003]|nr:MAG: hypothetical protein BEN19_02240 [Epulopiscium sp. Nuni2H_MBin003]
MNQMLLIRQSLIKFYKTYELFINMASKFIIILISMTGLNQVVGVSTVLNNIWVTLGISAISMFIPMSYVSIILMLIVIFHLSQISIILAGIGTLICFITYVMYIRLFPKESVAILFTMLLLHIEGVYIIPIVGGLFFGVPYIGAIIVGCFFSYLLAHLAVLINSNITEISVANLELIVVSLMENTIFNEEMITVISILSVTFLVVYVIRLLPMDFAPYIAACIGGVVNALGFLLARILLNLNVSMGMMILMTLIGVCIAVFMQFMVIVLDYNRAQTVSFEDESNYYFVKVIPKVELQTDFNKTEKIFGTTENLNSDWQV